MATLRCGLVCPFDFMMTKATPSKSIHSGLALILLACFFWSFSGALIKMINQSPDHPNGITIAFYRSVFASFFLYGLLLLRRVRTRESPTSIKTGGWTTYRRTYLWSAVFFTIMALCYVIANTRIAAGSAIVLQYTSTFWICGLSAWVLKERPQAGVVWFILLGFAGVAIIFVGEAIRSEAGRQADPLGVLLALGAGLFYALLTLRLRELKSADSIFSILIICATSAVMLVPFVWWFGNLKVSTWTLWLLVITGVVQFGLPYYLYTLGLARVPASQAALITLIEPVLVPIWAYLAVRDPLPKYTAVGGGLILVALMLSLRAARRNALLVESS